MRIHNTIPTQEQIDKAVREYRGVITKFPEQPAIQFVIKPSSFLYDGWNLSRRYREPRGVPIRAE